MAIIALEGMRFHAFHGVYEAEQLLGTEYVVDVYVQTDIGKAAKEDKVEYTINYETIYQICRLEMDKRRQLIETVLTAIVGRMKQQFPTMAALRIRVRKCNPPLGGRVDASWVEIEEVYLTDCPRCKKKYIQFNNDDCWLRFPNLHPATKETLERQFGKKCLCDDCLKFYAG
jgi:7,8-dihydroneopterin aldolase/epimerase/oxygenase